MKILYISKDKFNEQTVKNSLKDLSERDSIIFFDSYYSAQIFIENSVFKNLNDLDLIITENNIGKQSALDFFQTITNNIEQTYSTSNFNFLHIPKVLIVDKEENASAFSLNKFSIVVDFIPCNELYRNVSKFSAIVKYWRKCILDELDNLGIKFNSGNIDYTEYLLIGRNKNIETNILSSNFKKFPRRLKYDWVLNNESQIEIAIDKLITQLKQSKRLSRKNEEKKMHKIFNDFPSLIIRDNYSRHWYEPRMHYNKTEFYEPDYVLKPNFSYDTDLSILEVKLPNEGFMQKTLFHPKPYKKIIDHIFQVNDYKEFLESDLYKKEIIKAFGFYPTRVEYNILVGRSEEKNKDIIMFNKRMKQINSLHINFITYDELLDYQVKYLERFNLLQIR